VPEHLAALGRFDVGHFTDHYKNCLLVRPGVYPKGGGGYISGRGGDSPLGNGDPMSICVKIQKSTTIVNTGEPQSVSHHHDLFSGFFEQFFRGFCVFSHICLKTC